MTEHLVEHLGYVGIALILVLGGLGLPIPEEAPVILAGVLSRNGKMIVPFALAACLVGVLLGDFIVYGLGYYYGEKVLKLKLTRRLLTQAREAQIKGYFHRHGFKILILGRFAVGFRTAAYLTAGIIKLPPLKLFLTDLVAASLSTFVMFGLAFVFAQQIESGIREAQQWFAVALAVAIGGWLAYRHYKGQKRAGLPVGPPVLYGEEPPLPPDDLKTYPEDNGREVDVLLDGKARSPSASGWRRAIGAAPSPGPPPTAVPPRNSPETPAEPAPAPSGPISSPPGEPEVEPGASATSNGPASASRNGVASSHGDQPIAHAASPKSPPESGSGRRS
ncbi:DedA family protein [Aquisphaera giovannonii]|uniref:DedA family protein n=1 Tax=Aquisphaera giovannonii TaxID=406548 RepID=UPI0011DFE9CE|nr:DedA family protein [Aquisphaera giovannonii]